MKKVILTTMIALAFLQSQAQIVVNRYYVNHPYRYDHRYRHHDRRTNGNDVATAAIVTAGVVGTAAIIGACIQSSQEAKERKAAEALQFEQEKNATMQYFKEDMNKANDHYSKGNYLLALQTYVRCAQNNDKFRHLLGNQDMLVSRISDCNQNLGFSTSTPSVLNNFKVNSQDYSIYTTDIIRPAYNAKQPSCNTRITRISRNSRETRIELEYYNNSYGQVNVNIKPTTYIKGKKSGKLSLCRIENINMAPAATVVPYGCQTLKFALIFPALSPEDITFTFCEPSTDRQFSNISCI